MNQQAFNFVLRAACLLCLFCLTGGSAYAQFNAGNSGGDVFAGAFSIDERDDVRTANAVFRSANLASLGVTQACQLRFALINRVPEQRTINDLVIVATVTSLLEKNTRTVIIPVREGAEVAEAKVAFISTKLFNITLQPGTEAMPTVRHFMLPFGDAARLQQLIDDSSVGPSNLRVGFIINLETTTTPRPLNALGVSFYSALGATVSASVDQGGIVNVRAGITNTAIPTDNIPGSPDIATMAITQTGIEFLSTLPQQMTAVGSCRATVDGADIGNCAILRGSTVRFTIPFDPKKCDLAGRSCSNGLAPGKTVVVTYQARIAAGIPHCRSLLIRSATSETCQTVVTPVKAPDTTPPAVRANVAQSSFWPPNNDLINAGLAVQTSDDCTDNPAIEVRVYSDEDDLDGPGGSAFSPDARSIAPRTLRLRAERNGNKDGRVYVIVVKATDGAGNVGFELETVVVPKSGSQADRLAVHHQAVQAKAFFRANRRPPPGYFPVGDGPVIGPKQ